MARVLGLGLYYFLKNYSFKEIGKISTKYNFVFVDILLYSINVAN